MSNLETSEEGVEGEDVPPDGVGLEGLLGHLAGSEQERGESRDRYKKVILILISLNHNIMNKILRVKSTFPLGDLEPTKVNKLTTT